MLTCLAALAAAPSASAVTREIGAEPELPAASCPDNCQAIGRVTGFQTRAGEAENPYRIRSDGHIVAFTIKLGDPNAEQIQFFEGLFGGPARARLSVLRRRQVRRPRNQYRLLRHSDVFELTPYFGSTPSFVLRRPLFVRRNDILALTTPTYVPAFAVGLDQDQTWRSSRARDACDDVSQPAAQQTLGALRVYGCFYRTARLLYTATFVQKPRPTADEEGERGSSR
jgi:hypothetical protein